MPLQNFRRRSFIGAAFITTAAYTTRRSLNPRTTLICGAASGPVTFFDTKNLASRAEYYPSGGSASNMCEAEIAGELVTSLVRLHSSAVGDEILLIMPYSAQLHILSDICRRIPKMAQVSISTSTVDSMQGVETGLVIFSTVRSNPTRTVEFLNDLRRMNVGMTRARFSLIVVGDSETLSADKEGEWKKYLEYCKDDSLAYTHYILLPGSGKSTESFTRAFSGKPHE